MARDSSEFSVLATALGIDRCLLLERRSAANLPHAAAAAVKLLFKKKNFDPVTQFPGNEKLSLCSTKKYLTPPLDRLRPSGSLVHGMPAENRARLTKSVLFCSLAVLDPRVGHTVDVLSPFIPVLCHSD